VARLRRWPAVCVSPPATRGGGPVTSVIGAIPSSPPAIAGWAGTTTAPQERQRCCARRLGPYNARDREGSGRVRQFPGPSPCSRAVFKATNASPRRSQPPPRQPGPRRSSRRGSRSARADRPASSPRDLQPEDQFPELHSAPARRPPNPSGQPHRRCPDGSPPEPRRPASRSCSGANSCCPGRRPASRTRARFPRPAHRQHRHRGAAPYGTPPPLD